MLGLAKVCESHRCRRPEKKRTRSWPSFRERTGFKADGFEASRATIMRSELGQYRIVHFATHGIVDYQHPELSGLVLSLVDEQGQTAGWLPAHARHLQSEAARRSGSFERLQHRIGKGREGRGVDRTDAGVYVRGRRGRGGFVVEGR